MGFERVAKTEDLWSGEMMGLEVHGRRILLVNIDSRIYAHLDACPHQNSRLSEGTLTDNILRCARHHWEFDVCSGSGVNPRNARLTPLPVKLDGEDILVDIDAVGTLGSTAKGERDR
jgi:nitrite reductase/ring-hydroxylating ferredoxin subunit